MPAKSKKNYRAMANSDELAWLASEVHKKVTKGTFVLQADLDALIRLANDLAKELRPAPIAGTLDPFLTEEPAKSDVAKLPTVSVPAVEKPKEEVKQKSGFLGR